MLSPFLIVVAAVLATHRVTRLITRDEMPFIAIPREAFAQRWATYVSAQTTEERHTSLNGSKTNVVMRSLAYLWECDWCMSIWVGAGIAYCTHQLSDVWWWHVVLLLLAASSITGLIAEREPE